MQKAEQTVSAECMECQGTGLKTGIGERGSLAVVCNSCRGSGEKPMTYMPFQGRQTRDDVTRVVQTNPGIVLRPELTQGGVSYQEWQQNPESASKLGREVREYYCPAWWYRTGNPALSPDWEECQGTASYAKCPLFPKKGECWARSDQEIAGRQESPPTD